MTLNKDMVNAVRKFWKEASNELHYMRHFERIEFATVLVAYIMVRMTVIFMFSIIQQFEKTME